MFSEVFDYIRYNKIPIIMAMMIVASVFASISFGQYTYFAAMGGLLVYCAYKNQYFESVFAFLLIWIFLGMVVNKVFPIQYSYFVLMIACASPMLSSYSAYIFKAKLLYALCLILPLVTIANLYAYQMGINLYVEIMTLEKVAAYNFSGYMLHPMWLAAINGMSNVTLLYLFYRQKNSNWLIKGGILIFLILSLYLSVVAASRSALAASLLAMAAMVYFHSKSSGKLVKSVVVVGIIAYLTVPFITSNSEAMQNKINSEERGEGSSRDVMWQQRLDEFQESPLWGIGFATGHTITGWKNTGSVESGSGWLSILSQTGFVAALLFLLFMRRAFVTVREIKEEGGLLILFGCVFIYLCAHSIFEGYLYTAGYCPCMFFWLTLCFFYEYNSFGYPEEVEDLIEDEEDECDDDENEGDE